MAELNNSSTGQWSEIDASNTSPSPDGWPNGTFFNQVEPIGRSTMGAIKRFWDRINGTITSAGSSGTYTYTPSSTSYPTAYVQGETYSFKADKASAGNDVININSLGAIKIFKSTTGGIIQISANDIQVGAHVVGQIDTSLDSGAGGYLITAGLASSSDTPAGSLLAFAGSSTPTGWLLCDGSAVSRTTYAALFTAISTAWGPGNGTTTFNLPDLRGRGLFGKDDMGGSAANRITSGISGITGTTLGSTGGNESMQSHTHTATVTDPGHLHGLPAISGTAGVAGALTAAYASGGSSFNSASATTGISVANTSTGAGSSQNMPPAAIVNFIIKT